MAVTINKAMIEIPPRFAGCAPVGPIPQGEKQVKLHDDWSGARGLAEDVRRYGAWMRAETEKRIGYLYPKIEMTAQMAGSAGVPSASGQDGRAPCTHTPRPDLIPLIGQKLTVIAWLWARTVRSPNPAFSHAEVPLASTFVLSSKAGKEAYVEPIVEGDGYRFTVKVGTPPEGAKRGTTAGKRAAFICLLSQSPIDCNHIRTEGKAGRMGQRLMAIVAEGARGRIYLSPTPEQIAVAESTKPEWSPEMNLPNNPRDFKTPNYGLTKFGDLFTPRQLVALTTFSDLVQEAIEKCRQDALAAGMVDDGMGLDADGSGTLAYAQAVGVYLGFGVSRCTDMCNALCAWGPTDWRVRHLFARQAIPMVWDFAETCPLNDSAGAVL